MSARLHRLLSPAVALLLSMLVGVPKARADAFSVRCVGYEREVILLPSGRSAGWSKVADPFDVTVDAERSLGWFPASTMRVDEQRAASLTVLPDSYRLDASSDDHGVRLMEWVVLDRVSGEVRHYAQRAGTSTEMLRRGGACQRLTPRF